MVWLKILQKAVIPSHMFLCWWCD